MIFKKVKKWWYWLFPTHLRSAKLVQALFALVRPWLALRYYVIADPADNSVTLSKSLFSHIKNNAHENDEARVFVFKVADGDSYGFMPNPCIEQPTQMCDIQYNDKYRCVGFETLCPSVGQIFYDYGLDAIHRAKLSVSICRTQQGKLYYQIERPKFRSENHKHSL